MSLLNDMLRDLSHHKPIADGKEGYEQNLLRSSSFTQKRSLPWASIIVIFSIVFICVLAINYGARKFIVNKGSAHIAAPNQLSPVVADDNKIAVEPDLLPPTITNISDNTNVSDNGKIADNHDALATIYKSEELSNHISDLLQQAERALGMDRLTAPIEDNAYGYYQKILSMDESNDDAKIGLDEIAKRYLAKAQEQLALGNQQASDALVQRARFVSARYVLAHETHIEEHITESSENTVADFSNESVQSIGQIKSQSEPPTEPVKEIIKPFNIVEAKTLSVSPNAAWKDEQLTQHAQELIKQNRQSEAQVILKNFIATEQKPVLSAALLADIYIQQGNNEAAVVIADEATYLPADIKSKIKAQAASGNGNDLQAIAILEKDLSAAENNEGYRSLLASLYHKTANYQQSIIIYQRLINSFGEKPAYWLGLALAYDGLSQYQSALQAYQRLRQFPQLQEQVTQYTDQRIAALRSQ